MRRAVSLAGIQQSCCNCSRAPSAATGGSLLRKVPTAQEGLESGHSTIFPNSVGMGSPTTLSFFLWSVSGGKGWCRGPGSNRHAPEKGQRASPSRANSLRVCLFRRPGHFFVVQILCQNSPSRDSFKRCDSSVLANLFLLTQPHGGLAAAGVFQLVCILLRDSCRLVEQRHRQVNAKGMPIRPSL